jgi:hypothetical protein
MERPSIFRERTRFAAQWSMALRPSNVAGISIRQICASADLAAIIALY